MDLYFVPESEAGVEVEVAGAAVASDLLLVPSPDDFEPDDEFPELAEEPFPFA